MAPVPPGGTPPNTTTESPKSTAFGVVLFRSVQGAMAAENLLIAAGVKHKLIGVPRHLSSNCGFCLRFDWQDRESIEALLPAARLGIQGIVGL